MMMKWIFLFWLIKLIFKKQVKKNQISCVFQFTKFNFSIRIAIVNNRTLLLINDFLHQYSEPFKAKDLQNYIVENDGQKVSVKNLLQILYDSPYVFPIKNNQFIARAGVFAGRWFSFKPSREEIQKGYFMIGHRATPFANPDIPPDYYSIFANEKLVEPESCTFSMNQALDNYSLFGEGYILPIMFNDRNSDVVLRKENTQLNLPTEITLTAWPLSKVSGGEKIQYGDRMLCRFLDWDNGVIEIFLQKKNEVLALSQEAIEREEWYSHFERALLEGFDRYGPCDGIDSQLANVFLENQETLCNKNCGSVEECMMHTSKIGFQIYGVESRIWRRNEEIPYAGKWIKKEMMTDVVMQDITDSFSTAVFDAFIKDDLYNQAKGKEPGKIEDFIYKTVPMLNASSFLNDKSLMANLQKRKMAIEKAYNHFVDYPIAELRKQLIKFYTRVSCLFFEIAFSGIGADKFPQHELIVLSQIYSHCSKMIEGLETPGNGMDIIYEEMQLSLEGMSETYGDVECTLKSALKKLRYENFSVM